MEQGTAASMRRSCRLAAALLTVLILGGCATQSPQESKAITSSAHPAANVVAPASTTVGPSVVDRRPAADKAFEIHSLWITSCDYGVFTLAEKKTGKSHVESLHDDLAALPGDPWAGHQITVTHYAAYINNKHKLRKGALLGSFTGGIAAALVQRDDEKKNKGTPLPGDTCSASEMHGGWYSGNDTTTYNPPIVIEISALVDGKPHEVRSVYSPSVDVIPKLKHPSDDNELAIAVHKADQAFAASMGSTITAIRPVTHQEAPAETLATSVASEPVSTPTPMPEPVATPVPVQAPAPTALATPVTTPDVAPSPVVAERPDLLARARELSTQLRCGDVQSTGDTTFVAQCSGYAVAIDCDGGRCHPTHTVKPSGAP